MDNSYYGLPPQSPRAYGQTKWYQFSKRTWILIGGGLLLVMLSIALIAASSGPNLGDIEARLNARIETTQLMLDEGIENGSNSDLRNLSSEISIVLASDTASLQATRTGAAPKSAQAKAIVAAEANQTAFDDLVEAKQNSRFDETYQRLLSSQLDSLAALMTELYGKSNSPDQRAALNTAFNNLSAYQDRLAELN